jgi:hypothetical protein
MTRKGEMSMENTYRVPGLEISPAPRTTRATTQPFRVDVMVTNPNELILLLDQAVQQLIPIALERRQGILVTQLLPDTYSVEVNEGVLFGMIQEKRINPEIP